MIRSRKPQKSMKLNSNLILKLKSNNTLNQDTVTSPKLKLKLEINNCKPKLKVRHLNILKNVTNRNFFAKFKQRKATTQKQSKLPSLNGRERSNGSPTKMSEFRTRLLSPLNSRARKYNSGSIPPAILTPEPCRTLEANTIECTEEQTIINEKAKMRVLEARMSRFTGFKSPRILLSKLIDRSSANDQYDYDIMNASEVTDEVHNNETVKNSLNSRLQNNDLKLLSL